MNVRAFFVLALLSAPAFADTVSVAIRAGVMGKQFPAVEVRILEPIAGFQLTLKRNDGKAIDVKGGGKPGVTRVVELDQPEGAFHYAGELSVNLPNGDSLNMPLEFDTNMSGPLRLDLNKDKDVDLDKRTIHFRLNHPAGKAKLTVILDSGKPLVDSEIPFNNEPAGTDLSVDWPETSEELLKVSLTAYDPNGMYSGIELFPYTVYVPHDEIVFDTGKADIREDQRPKVDKPLAELRKRIDRAKPWAPVKVRNSERKPTRPRAGMRNWRRVRPEPSAAMSAMRPLRGPRRSVTAPTAVSGTSHTMSSIGS